MAKLGTATPEGAYWVNAIGDQRSMDAYLREVTLIEGPVALDALRRCAGDLIEALGEDRFEEGA